MVAIKSHLAAGLIKSPDPRLTAFLFFGTDPGLVSERAGQLAKRLAETSDPPGDILRLDDADLETEPDRLMIELGTIPMFGGRKIVRATTGRRINTLALKPLVEGGPLAGMLIVEAGNLKPDEPLRALFEKNARTAAVACYGDEVADLSTLVREVLGAAGVKINPEAQQLLVSRLGADRSLSRGEIEKLALYASGKAEIDADDVMAIVGDATELAIDAALMSALSGNGARAVSECQRLIQSGESAQGIILALQRYLQRVHRVRAALNAGKSFDDVVRTLRPPLYFKHKPLLASHAQRWSLKDLAPALDEVAGAARQARFNGALEDEIAERLLWSIAERSRSLRSGGETRGV